MSDLRGWKRVCLGTVTWESRDRAQSESGHLQVYGVDRHEGLTHQAKYTSENLSKYKLLRPGMFAYNPMRLNIGSIAYCSKHDSPGLVSPDYVVFSCNEECLDPEFLKFAILGRDWTQWTTAAGVGSVRVRIYFNELGRMPLPIPPLDVQKSIAHILGTLDSTIELNQRMNETLEAMVRAIFKSWFVDFDPVRT